MALHCPATLLLAPPGDERQMLAIAQRVAGDHVARVWSGRLPAHTAAARVAADALDVGAVEVDGLEEVGAAELTAGALERVREALSHIADQHRGEAVLVLAPGGVISVVVPALVGGLRADRASEEAGSAAEPTRVEIGDDGWRALGRPGGPDRLHG
jgi:hypothetical protein